MLRRFVTMFSEIIRKRSSSRRRELREPLPITVTLPPPAVAVMIGEGDDRRREFADKNPIALKGKVRDLSDEGIAFVVPVIRLGENYLAGENKILNAEITLPQGNVLAQITGERYKPLGDEIPAAEYLIGARIVWMSEADRRAYRDYLSGALRKTSKHSFLNEYDEQTG